MEKLKSNLPNMALVLTVVAVLCSGILAAVNNATSSTIEEQKKQATADGIKVVLQSDNVEVTNEYAKDVEFGGKKFAFTIYETSEGVAIKSDGPNSFSGKLNVMVGFNKEGDILGYKVMETEETPGLGAKAQDWFQKGAKGDIIGKNAVKDDLTVSKDGGQIDAITASTITSRAFLAAVRQAWAAYNDGSDAKSGATQQANNN